MDVQAPALSEEPSTVLWDVSALTVDAPRAGSRSVSGMRFSVSGATAESAPGVSPVGCRDASPEPLFTIRRSSQGLLVIPSPDASGMRGVSCETAFTDGVSGGASPDPCVHSARGGSHSSHGVSSEGASLSPPQPRGADHLVDYASPAPYASIAGVLCVAAAAAQARQAPTPRLPVPPRQRCPSRGRRGSIAHFRPCDAAAACAVAILAAVTGTTAAPRRRRRSCKGHKRAALVCHTVAPCAAAAVAVLAAACVEHMGARRAMMQARRAATCAAYTAAVCLVAQHAPMHKQRRPLPCIPRGRSPRGIQEGAKVTPLKHPRRQALTPLAQRPPSAGPSGVQHSLQRRGLGVVEPTPPPPPAVVIPVPKRKLLPPVPPQPRGASPRPMDEGALEEANVELEAQLAHLRGHLAHFDATAHRDGADVKAPDAGLLGKFERDLAEKNKQLARAVSAHRAREAEVKKGKQLAELRRDAAVRHDRQRAELQTQIGAVRHEKVALNAAADKIKAETEQLPEPDPEEVAEAALLKDLIAEWEKKSAVIAGATAELERRKATRKRERRELKKRVREEARWVRQLQQRAERMEGELDRKLAQLQERREAHAPPTPRVVPP